MKYREMSRQFSERDDNAVRLFNISPCGIEDNISFVSNRVEHIASVLVALLNKLAEEEDAKEEGK
jgi:hypothetical protein